MTDATDHHDCTDLPDHIEDAVFDALPDPEESRADVRFKGQMMADATVMTEECHVCGADLYRVCTDTHHVETYRESGSETYLNFANRDDLWALAPDDRTDPPVLCEECTFSIIERGSRVRGRTADGHRTAFRHMEGICATMPYMEHADTPASHKHPLEAAMMAVARGDDTIPFDGGDIHAARRPREGVADDTEYETVDRVIEGDEFVVAELETGVKYDDHRASSDFVDAVFTDPDDLAGDAHPTASVALPTPAVATDHGLFVPEGDADLVREMFDKWFAGARERTTKYARSRRARRRSRTTGDD